MSLHAINRKEILVSVQTSTISDLINFQPSMSYQIIKPPSINLSDIMASQRQWHFAAILSIAVVLLTPFPAAAYYNAQFSNVTVFNQLGSGSLVQLSCYKLDITTRWFRAPEFKWVKIVDNVRLVDGAVVSMSPCMKVTAATVAACTIVANNKGEECSWTIYNDDNNFEDKIGYDKAWYLRPDGIFNEVVDEVYKRPAKFQLQYCKEFSLKDLRSGH